MEDVRLLMLPGPVPLPERVCQAMMRQAINHRGPEFGAAYTESVEVLKECFGTTHDVLILSGSGTAGMDAAISNFGKGKKIASLVNGKFGDRLYQIAARNGDATEIASEWGTPVDLAALEDALENGTEMVTMVHNETSAGILNPAKEVGKLAHKHDALFVMDGVTSVGGDEVLADKWGVDVAIVGSQKCLAAPAGLAAVAVSDRAWDRIVEDRPFYLDLASYRKSAKKEPMQTPYTPAVPLFLGLHESLMMIKEEGMAARVARHRKMSASVRAAVAAWGLEMFPQLDEHSAYSNTVTAVRMPEGVADADVRGKVKQMGIEIAGGQDHLKGKIFRIGSMGAVSAPEILATLAAVQHALRKAGVAGVGDGVEAAAEVLDS